MDIKYNNKILAKIDSKLELRVLDQRDEKNRLQTTPKENYKVEYSPEIELYKEPFCIVQGVSVPYREYNKAWIIYYYYSEIPPSYIFHYQSAEDKTRRMLKYIISSS